MKIKKIIFPLLILLLTLGISSAEIYRWVDENGVIHYSDSPNRIPAEPDQDENEEIQLPDPPPAGTPPLPDESPEGNLPGLDFSGYLDESRKETVTVKAPKVEIYETSWCGYCKKAKKFFRSKGIDFIAYDIEKDPQAARRMMKMTDRRAVPFVVINGQRISGYSVAAYERALQN